MSGIALFDVAAHARVIGLYRSKKFIGISDPRNFDYVTCSEKQKIDYEGLTRGKKSRTGVCLSGKKSRTGFENPSKTAAMLYNSHIVGAYLPIDPKNTA